MPIDFSPLQQIDPAGAFLQGRERAQAQAERNALRQMQMQQMAMQQENLLAQRGEREALAAQRRATDARAAQRQQFLTGAAEALAKGGEKLDRPTLMKVLQSGVQADEPTLIQFAREGLKALEEEDLYRQEATRFGLPGGAPAAAPAMRAPVNALPAAPAAPVNMFAGTLADIGTTQPAPVNALAAPPAAAPGVTREMVQQMLTSPSARIREQGKALLQTLEKPERPYEPSELQKTLADLKLAVPGSREAQALEARARILTTREPKEPKEPSAPIPVVDEATGKVKYVSREEAIGKTPPSAMEGLAPKEIQRREAVFPQAKQSVATVTSTMTEVENTIDRLLKNPKGLNGITGLVYGRTPALTDDARRAESDIKQLRNLAFVQGLTELRAASKTGAGVGNVSNKEGDRFENLKASLETTQSFDDMVAALKRLKAQTSATKTNLQTEFEDMYSYRQGRQTSTGPAAGASPYQNLSNEELLRQLGVKPGGR